MVASKLLKNAAGIRAFYFRDPDNHFLEILQFPPDKGDAKWHRSKSPLFLGIDHTAIVVGSTEVGLRFYRDGLGMRVVGESENYGTEQEHLNNIFGVRLRITGLRSSGGPGIELLEYLAPRDGRMMPADSHSNDIWAWQTTVVVGHAGTAGHALLLSGATRVSSGLITFLIPDLGFTKAFLVRDSDGHLRR